MDLARCCEPTIEQRELLDRHLRLVIEANERVNLTRIDTWESGQVLHVEDSLVGLPEILEAPQGRYLDMGTGAGFPGVPVAIMTGRETVLADSVGKKTAVLDEVLRELNISDYASTFNGRLEDLALQQPESFSVVSARALSSLSSLLELASPLLCEGGVLVCYKAPSVYEELDHTSEIEDMLGFQRMNVRDAVLSDGATARVIVSYEKVHASRVPLPRRVGMAQKRPY